MIAAILTICGTAAFASCTANDDNSAGQAVESRYVPLAPDYSDPESMQYGINIIDHAAEPMQQSIIVVRQLLQYVQGLVNGFQQPQGE